MQSKSQQDTTTALTKITEILKSEKTHVRWDAEKLEGNSYTN